MEVCCVRAFDMAWCIELEAMPSGSCSLAIQDSVGIAIVVAESKLLRAIQDKKQLI